jgi:hypothetical protein
MLIIHCSKELSEIIRDLMVNRSSQATSHCNICPPKEDAKNNEKK